MDCCVCGKKGLESCYRNEGKGLFGVVMVSEKFYCSVCKKYITVEDECYDEIFTKKNCIKMQEERKRAGLR